MFTSRTGLKVTNDSDFIIFQIFELVKVVLVVDDGHRVIRNL